jgi:predicted PurR-regulated permease PerM
LLVVAAFVAIGLDPLVNWLEVHGIRRRYAAPLTILVILLVLIGFGYLAGASLVEQSELLGHA